MDFNGIIVLLNAIIFVIADFRIHRKCSSEKNQYYRKHLNSCLLCDKCLPGEGTNLTAVVEVDDICGALRCRPCIKCTPGMYNRRRAFKCKPCKDCAASGRTVKIACAPGRKEVCGKRIKIITNSTAEPTQAMSTVQHHPGDRERTVKADNNGHTFQNNHTHINISLIVFLVLFGGSVIIVGVTYNVCCRGNHDCSLRQANMIGDCQPIMIRSGSECPSVVSVIPPYQPLQKPINGGLNNNVYTTVDHEARHDNTDDVLHTQYDHYRPQSQSSNSREHGTYSEIRQEEQSSRLQPRNIEHDNYELSSDVEEDAVPSFITGRVNTVRYSAENTDVKYIPSDDANYHTQPSVDLSKDNNTTNRNILDEGKRKKNQRELEKFAEKVSRYIAPNHAYQTLGRHLNLSTTDIDIIKEDYPYDVKERAYRTLRKWMERHPELGVDDLKKAICDIGREDILERKLS